MLLPDIGNESSSSSSDMLEHLLDNVDFCNAVPSVSLPVNPPEGRPFQGKKLPLVSSAKRRPRPSSSRRKRTTQQSDGSNETFQRLKFNHEHLAVASKRNQNIASRRVLDQLNNHITESIKQRDQLISSLLDESFQPCIANINSISGPLRSATPPGGVTCMICMKIGADTQITNCKCIGHKSCFVEWFQCTTWCCCGLHQSVA